MSKREDGERIASLEANMENISEKVNNIENSIQALHGKVDAFATMLSENYVAKATFEEYKKNKILNTVITVLVTAMITGLVAFFFREAGV